MFLLSTCMLTTILLSTCMLMTIVNIQFLLIRFLAISFGEGNGKPETLGVVFHPDLSPGFLAQPPVITASCCVLLDLFPE